MDKISLLQKIGDMAGSLKFMADNDCPTELLDECMNDDYERIEGLQTYCIYNYSQMKKVYTSILINNNLQYINR